MSLINSLQMITTLYKIKRFNRAYKTPTSLWLKTRILKIKLFYMSDKKYFDNQLT